MDNTIRALELKQINQAIQTGVNYTKLESVYKPRPAAAYIAEQEKEQIELKSPLFFADILPKTLNLILYPNRKIFLKGVPNKYCLQHGYVTLEEISDFIKLGKSIYATVNRDKKDVTNVILRKVLRQRLEDRINGLTTEELLNEVKQTNE